MYVLDQENNIIELPCINLKDASAYLNNRNRSIKMFKYLKLWQLGVINQALVRETDIYFMVKRWNQVFSYLKMNNMKR